MPKYAQMICVFAGPGVAGFFLWDARMRETDEKAKSGMIRFVLAIFAIAVVLAFGYFVFLTPGETTSTTIDTQQ